MLEFPNFIAYSSFGCLLALGNIPSKPSSLLFGEVVSVSFEEFFHFFFPIFAFKVANDFFIADALHGLKLRCVTCL